jgi:twitching motility two-component system response regulator PilH
MTKIRENMDLRNKRILIVDDDSSFVAMLEYILAGEGYAVETASDGFDALEKDLTALPDLIVLDIMMPKIDGYKFARMIKSNPNTREIKLIICSARANTGDVQRGLELGADAYLCKPFNPDHLLAKIHTLLS